MTSPEMQEAAVFGGFRIPVLANLVQRICNQLERAVQARTNGVDARNDHDRYTGCDQAVLDRRCARLVLEKRDKCRHVVTPGAPMQRGN